MQCKWFKEPKVTPMPHGLELILCYSHPENSRNEYLKWLPYARAIDLYPNKPGVLQNCFKSLLKKYG